MGKNILALILAFVFITCNENSVNNNEKPFSLNVQVTDSNNNLLKNINVSVWDRINNNTMSKHTSQNNILAATTISFDLIQDCFVSMNIYTLDNNIVDGLVSKELHAGSYAYTWDTLIPNGVFKCILTTSSDSLKSEIFFKDSIYLVLIAPDPRISLIGKTDADGRITTSNKLLFANIYNLPSMPLTYETGPEIVGQFTFSDSVTIALSDESFSTVKLYYCEIKDGENKVSLNWDEGILQLDNNLMSGDKLAICVTPLDSVYLPKDWSLRQNYPNPFN